MDWEQTTGISSVVIIDVIGKHSVGGTVEEKNLVGVNLRKSGKRDNWKKVEKIICEFFYKGV